MPRCFLLVDAVNVVKAIVFQRVLDPGSERSLVRSFPPNVFAPEPDGIEPQHAYRALQFLAEVGPEVEVRLTRVTTEKLFADASLVLFDTTSTYFEGADPEELASLPSRPPANSGRCSTPAKPASTGTCKPACSPTDSCASSRIASTPHSRPRRPRAPRGNTPPTCVRDATHPPNCRSWVRCA